MAEDNTQTTHTDYGHWLTTQERTKFHIGFVYLIRELNTGMKYYGIKKLHKRIRRKPLKGYKRVRIDYVESDWKTYITSSPIMQKKITENKDNYVFAIVDFCESVTDMKAREAYYQLKHYVDGMFHELYNEVINLRLRIR